MKHCEVVIVQLSSFAHKFEDRAGNGSVKLFHI